MGMTATLLTTALSAGYGAYSARQSQKTAGASRKAANEATFAAAEREGRAAAKEEVLRGNAISARAKEAENLDIEESSRLSKRKRGVQSTYTSSGAGSGAGMMKGTSLTPIGGGETGAVG